MFGIITRRYDLGTARFNSDEYFSFTAVAAWAAIRTRYVV